MRLFVDTSSLFKRYIQDDGSAALERLFEEASEIVVSPVTWVELNSALSKRLRDGSLSSEQFSAVLLEAKKDFDFFARLEWNESLDEKAVEIVKKFGLKSLDAIQLSSGLLSKADIFVTSDKKLFEVANKIVRKARFI